MEKMSRRTEGPSTRGAPVIQEPSSSQVELQKVNERLNRMYSNGTEIMVKACKLGFSMDFERCKEMTRVHLLMNDAESLRMDPLDKSLKIMIDHYLGKFASASDSLVRSNKVDSVV